MQPRDDITGLIASLGSADRRERPIIERQLMSKGSKAVAELLSALNASNPAIRQSIIFILGKLAKKGKNPEIAQVLGQTLSGDPEPEIRMNAAIALGKTGYPEALYRLNEALSKEDVPWVRSSIILALGAIGTDEAYQVLKDVIANDEEEAGALRKALDRCKHDEHRISWQTSRTWNSPIYLEVPLGLETLCIDEGAELSLTGLKYAKPGRLLCPPESAPWDVFPKMRSAYGIRIFLSRTPLPDAGNTLDLNQAVSKVLTDALSSLSITDWFKADTSEIRYRFSLEKLKVGRNNLRNLLQQVRKVCLPYGLKDSPSNYDIELLASVEGGEIQLYLKPSFVPDDRFDYRKSDVGASINPVIGSILARLLKAKDGGIVFDPTCGSGTLLIETALSGFQGSLAGLDISQTAVRAAQTNIRAAGLDGCIRVAKGDASSPENWPVCDRVIANLPFGLRVKDKDLEIAGLYDNVAVNLASHLRRGGRAVLYTASKKALEQSFARHKSLKRAGGYKVVSGGLTVFIWVLEKI